MKKWPQHSSVLVWYLGADASVLYPGCILVIILCVLHRCTYMCVTLTPYIKGPPGTLYCIKYLHTQIYLSTRPLARESYDRYMLLRKPSLLLGKGITNHTQIQYVWEIKQSPLGLVLYPTYIPIGHDDMSLTLTSL